MMHVEAVAMINHGSASPHGFGGRGGVVWCRHPNTMHRHRDKNIVKNTDSSTHTLGQCVCPHMSAVWYSNVRASLPAHLVDIG